MSTNTTKIAFFDFAGCEGCQLTVLDALQTNLDLLEAVEIVQFREAMSEQGEDYKIAFIEGSCTRPSDETRLKAIREKAQIVVALGTCACIGGVNAVRNSQPPESVRRYVYGEKADIFDTCSVQPIGDVIPIDAYIPGCPIDGPEFLRSVKALLRGLPPDIPDYPVCVECKLRENDCLFLRGEICLGPITRAGCGALCPTYGSACVGCRGLILNPNIERLREVLIENGLRLSGVLAKLGLFNTNYIMESEVGGDDR
jgi:sulfhydrogenase subunit delta